ncbi:MAG: hypothetical protein H7A35_09410 [Planctomycetales bacterium]|nr:hypothetical protein [bacterium]UNM07095.1 MAG: hypothetical protein H7A35_09410 [Planctomycetales bacterium]
MNGINPEARAMFLAAVISLLCLGLAFWYSQIKAPERESIIEAQHRVRNSFVFVD